jgi:hypothetical protein
VAELLQRLGQVELLEGEDLRGDLAEDRGLAPVVVEVVAAEAREAGDLVGEVEVLAFEEILPARGGQISLRSASMPSASSGGR